MTVPVDAWIHALQLRLKLVAPHRRVPPGEFPPGWQQWFASMSPRAGAVTGASPRSIAAAMADRPLKTPPRASAPLSRWQALTALGRQQWEPAPRDERGLRRFATVFSLGWHVLLAAILAWLIYQQYINPSHPPPKGEEMVVQIEYVGEGTPDQVGGGPATEPGEQESTPAPPTPVEDASDAPTTSSAPPPVAVEQPTPEPPAVVPAPPSPAEDPETAEAAAVQASQPLSVSEPVGDVDDDFVLPPTAERLDAPALTAPELQMSAPTLEVVDVPAAPRPVVSIIEASPAAPPVLEQRPADVVVREIPIPAPSEPLPTSVPLPRIPSPRPSPSTVLVAPPSELQAPALQTREIPAVTAAPAASPTPSTAATPTVSQSTEPAAQPASPAIKPPGAADQPGVSSNAGPKQTPTAGGGPDPKRADDWGADMQERPGKQLGQADGLYNSDGSAKLAETPGSASPGKPPGTITDEIVNLDRNGTWLKRAPTDYEPTAFDQYWRPTETLLEEWVRKSVSTIRIPIPGTSKHIVCHTVLLALGGACGISDPNLVDQPATARPSPDIPFKPELQDDNGSVPPGD